MKYLVHVTAKINTQINADNLRGEPRWERNVLDALVASGREVHTTMKVWDSTDPLPDNLYDGLNSDWQDDSILITYGVPQTPHISTHAKYYVVQYLDGPFPETKDTFLKYHNEKPGSIVATCGFLGWNYIRNLEGVLGKDKVEFVQGPTVPFVDDEADNFNKPYLFWAYRNFWACSERDPSGMRRLCDKLSSFMDRDPSLELVFTIGAFNPEIIADPKKDGYDWVLSFPFTKSLEKHKHRIKVLADLHWHEMLDIMSKTRLVVATPEPLGCPPFEAAMYGIPTILKSDVHPFQTRDRRNLFPEVLTASRDVDGAFLAYLERLFTDHSFYRHHGDGYRRYVKENATYDAYIKQLDHITSKRGWK